MDEAVLGRYRLLPVIYEGATSTPCQAHDAPVHRDVTLKVLPTALATEPASERRLRRETHVRLTKPHITPFPGEIAVWPRKQLCPITATTWPPSRFASGVEGPR